VTGFGMIPTEMLLLRRRRPRFRRWRGRYGVAQPGPVQRHEARRRGRLPLSGDAGIPELKRRVLDMDPAPRAAAPHLIADDLYPDYVEHLLAQVEAGALHPGTWSWTPPTAPPASSRPWSSTARRFERVELVLRSRRALPQPRSPIPARGQQPRAARTASWPRRPISHRLDGDADRCFFHRRDRRLRARRFVTALLAEALLARHSRRQHLYDLRASRAVPRHHPGGRRRGVGEPRGATPSSSSAMRASRCCSVARSRATTTSRPTTTPTPASSRAAHPRAAVAQAGDHGRAAGAAARHLLHLGRDQTRGSDDVPAALARLEQRFADGAIAHLDGVSVDYPDWHFNVRPSNTEPLLAPQPGATSAAQMEEKRDLVLSVILRDGGS